MWVHRTYRNLPSLGASDLNYSPGWAVGYYFIPILNLFRPYQVMRETWQASDPRNIGQRDWKYLAAPALLSIWWAMHVISRFVDWASFRVTMRGDNEELLYVFAWIDLLMTLFDALLIGLEIKIVVALTAMQDDRAATRGTIDPGSPPTRLLSPWQT
jgi:hypothetical protein